MTAAVHRRAEVELPATIIGIERAQELMSSNLKEAWACYREALRSCSSPEKKAEMQVIWARALFSRMRPPVKKGEPSHPPDFRASRIELQEALRLGFNSAKILGYLALTYRMEKPVNVREARMHYEEGLAKPDFYLELCFDYVEFLLKEGRDPNRAVEVCTKALEKNPNHPDLLYFRAKAHDSLEQWMEALRDCEASLKGEESNYRDETLELAARIYFQKIKEFAKARDSIVLISNISVFNDLSWELLEAQFAAKISLREIEKRKLDCMILLAHKKPQEALQLFQQIDFELLSLPERFNGLAACARALIEDPEKLGEARQVLEEAEKLDFQKTENNLLMIYSLLACICLEEGKPDEAEQYYERGWRLHEVDRDFLIEYLNFLREREDHQKALQICKSGKGQWALGEQTAFYFLARLQATCGNKEEAKEACKEFLRGQCSVEQRLEILDLAISLEDEEEEKYFLMQEACKWDFSSKYEGRFEALLEFYGQLCQRESFFFESLPKKDVDHMLKAAALHSKKNPKEALAIYKQIDFEQLSLGDRFRAQMGRATAFIALKDFISARKDLEEVLRPFFLPAWRRRLSGSPLPVPPEEVAKAFCCLAQLCVQEEKLQDAEAHFKAAWKTCQTDQGVAIQCIRFLAGRQESEKTLKICKALDKVRGLYYKIYIHFARREWEQVKEVSEEFLSKYPLPREEDRLRWLASLRLQVLEFAIDACLKLRGKGDLLQAKAHALQAYYKDKTRFAQRLEKYKWLVVEEHFEEFLAAFGKKETQFTNSQMVVCITRFLKTHAKYFPDHPKARADLLWIRGQKQAEEGNLEGALCDYEEVETAVRHNPSNFPPNMLDLVIKARADLLWMLGQKQAEEGNLEGALYDHEEEKTTVHYNPSDVLPNMFGPLGEGNLD